MYYVLGGRGFVGSAVCAMLTAEGQEFACIDLDNYSKFAGSTCDVLVNCNGNSRRFWGNENSLQDFEANVDSTMRSFSDFSFNSYVYISTVDVYPDTVDPEHNAEDTTIEPESLCPYGFHKWISEMLVRRYAPCWLIMRLGGMVGPGLKKNPIYDAMNNQPIRISPESRLSIIHTRNVTAALWKLLVSGYRNEVFNVCGTGTFTIGDLQELVGREVTFAPGAEHEKQIYHINNSRIRNIMSIPESTVAIAEFVRKVQ